MPFTSDSPETHRLRPCCNDMPLHHHIHVIILLNHVVIKPPLSPFPIVIKSRPHLCRSSDSSPSPTVVIIKRWRTACLGPFPTRTTLCYKSRWLSVHWPRAPIISHLILSLIHTDTLPQRTIIITAARMLGLPFQCAPHYTHRTKTASIQSCALQHRPHFRQFFRTHPPTHNRRQIVHSNVLYSKYLSLWFST